MSDSFLLIACLASALTAGIVSFGVCSLMQYATRLRVRQCEAAIDDFDEVITRYNKKRAAEASVAARRAAPLPLGDFDAQVLRQHGLAAAEEPAWYDHLLKGRTKNGTPQ